MFIDYHQFELFDLKGFNGLLRWKQTMLNQREDDKQKGNIRSTDGKRRREGILTSRGVAISRQIEIETRHRSQLVSVPGPLRAPDHGDTRGNPPSLL